MTPPSPYNDTGTVVFAGIPSGVSACEIALYYPGHDGEEVWRIRPISVSLVAGTATITFRRELAVAENLLESFDLPNLRPVDGTDDGSLLVAVQLYPRWHDPPKPAHPP